MQRTVLSHNDRPACGHHIKDKPARLSKNACSQLHFPAYGDEAHMKSTLIQFVTGHQLGQKPSAQVLGEEASLSKSLQLSECQQPSIACCIQGLTGISTGKIADALCCVYC